VHHSGIFWLEFFYVNTLLTLFILQNGANWDTLCSHGGDFDVLLKKNLKKCFTLCVNVFVYNQKKGTKAVTGAVPFQKVNFCPF